MSSHAGKLKTVKPAHKNIKVSKCDPRRVLVPEDRRREVEAEVCLALKEMMRVLRRKANDIPLPEGWVVQTKISWNIGRGSSWGGRHLTAAGAIGWVSLALHRYAVGDGPFRLREYAHIAKDPTIGTLESSSWRPVVRCLLAHELAHAVQRNIRKVGRHRKIDYRTAHGDGWQKVYALLRRECVNPIAVSVAETRNGAAPMKEVSETANHNAITSAIPLIQHGGASRNSTEHVVSVTSDHPQSDPGIVVPATSADRSLRVSIGKEIHVPMRRLKGFEFGGYIVADSPTLARAARTYGGPKPRMENGLRIPAQTRRGVVKTLLRTLIDPASRSEWGQVHGTELGFAPLAVRMSVAQEIQRRLDLLG